MKTIDKMTNWDAKKSFSEYVIPKFIPVIYIDEYWDYYINLFNMKNKWDKFLENFINSNLTYKSFSEEYNRIVYLASGLLLNSPIEKAKQKIYKESFNIPPEETIPIMNIECEKYINVDIHNAIDTVLKYIGIFNESFNDTYEIIKSLTPYDIFYNLKSLRLSIYDCTFENEKDAYYKLFEIITSTLINKIINSSNPEIKLLNEQSKIIHRTKGDAVGYEYNEDLANNIMGNYTYDNIGYHISVVEIKNTTVLGKKIRCIRGFKKNGPGGFKVFYLPKGRARPEIWPIAIKKAFNDLGELNEKDLTIGYEDQIFFQFDKSEV